MSKYFFKACIIRRQTFNPYCKMVSFFIKEIFASISMGNYHKMNFSHHLYLCKGSQ
ncbi:hypothetical protein [uncultured Gammaproteobacteria bacterium]|nr:hypothetical protein [uncultured Gammaproteobacteria bacterium]